MVTPGLKEPGPCLFYPIRAGSEAEQIGYTSVKDKEEAKAIPVVR